MNSWLARLKPDAYSMAIVGMVVLASVLPVGEAYAPEFHVATNLAIALLFFLHGARLSREAILAGMTHWKLHLVVFAATFVMFPVFGVTLQALAPSLAGLGITPGLAAGVLFLCCLPSTVQSSIAFTSMAGGNIPAAVCSASASNLIGVFLTPILAGLLMGAAGKGGADLHSIEAIVTQLLLPFAAGQALRPWIGAWAGRHKKLLSYVDRGSILMVVYGAFSEAVQGGLWRQMPASTLFLMILTNLILLAFAMIGTNLAAKKLGFSFEDRVTIVFCGSKKSLASGAPIANILFSGPMVGMVVLPVMLFHQFQLMACAVLAKYWAEHKPEGTVAAE